VSAGSSKGKIKVTSLNVDEDKKGSSDSIDSSDDKPKKCMHSLLFFLTWLSLMPLLAVLTAVKIQAPKSATVQSLTPRESGVGVVRVTMSSPFAHVDEAVTLSTSAVKSPDGEVLKGHLSDYEIDIMGPNNLDGEISRVHDDGSFELKFTPTAAGSAIPPFYRAHLRRLTLSLGKYFVQVYLNDIPLLGDYYEVTAKVAEPTDSRRKKK
jgi:hypothetical protein